MSKEFNLENYVETEETQETIYKPIQYINMPKCFQDAIGLPGIPLGYSSMFYGLSDCGKTDILLKVARQALNDNILPIIAITENKLDRERLEKHGLFAGKNCILKEDITTLEDMYDYISSKIVDIKNGKLKMNTIFLWDSTAATPSKASFEIDKEGKITQRYGPQKNASVIGYYNPIIMKMVTSTRQMDCDYSFGLFMLNQAYVKPPEFPGAPSSIVSNGGEKIWFPLSLSVEVKEGKRHKATFDGKDIEYALTCRLKVKKNHINGIYSSGEVILAGNEMFENDDKLIKQYKEIFKDKK